MPAYSYHAINAKGKNVKGVVAADSLRDARIRLQKKAVFATDIQLAAERKKAANWSLMPSHHPAIGKKQLVMITRQLATMIASGSSVEESLAAITEQAEKKAVRDVLTRIRSDVMEGKKLSEALRAEPASFDTLYCAMVAAGEYAGNLGGVLEKIADYGEKTEAVKSKIQAAMIYPAVLSTVASFVLILLMVMVVPKVVSQFAHYEAKLPTITRVVMAVSDFLSHQWGWLLALIAAAVVGWGLMMRHAKMRLLWHRFLLSLPLIGQIIRAVSSARFARTLGTLVEGGSPVLQAVQAARETVHNVIIRRDLDQVYRDILEGVSLSSALKKSPYFAPLMVHMAVAGERSGSLAKLMIKVADYLEQDFDRASETALNLLEPMIVIIMGILVGVIVMSIMLPIMQLNTLVLG